MKSAFELILKINTTNIETFAAFFNMTFSLKIY